MTRTVQQLFDLTGKTALITGGSRGLGLQMAHALGEAGARLMISSRKAEDLEAATAELQAAGIDARWMAADCGQEADIRRLADETLQRMGDIDILVNNAGAAWGSPAEDHPVEAWDKVMNLNVRGYFILSQHVAKHCMIERRRGSILNVASIAGEVEGQATTTQEIADKISQTSAGIQEVNQNVSQGSVVIGSITNEMAEVNKAVQQSSVSIGQINEKSAELSSLSNKLQDLVGRFKV